MFKVLAITDLGARKADLQMRRWPIGGAAQQVADGTLQRILQAAGLQVRDQLAHQALIPLSIAAVKSDCAPAHH